MGGFEHILAGFLLRTKTIPAILCLAMTLSHPSFILYFCLNDISHALWVNSLIDPPVVYTLHKHSEGNVYINMVYIKIIDLSPAIWEAGVWFLLTASAFLITITPANTTLNPLCLVKLPCGHNLLSQLNESTVFLNCTHNFSPTSICVSLLFLLLPYMHVIHCSICFTASL